MATKREILSFLKRKMEEKKSRIHEESMEIPKEIDNLRSEAARRINEALGSLGLSIENPMAKINFNYIKNDKGQHIGDCCGWSNENGLIKPFIDQFNENKKKKFKALETEFNKVEEALVMNGLDDSTRALVEAFKTILES